MASGDAVFDGSIPQQYERLLVPLMFAEPARHLARAVLAGRPTDVLETAAGTGILTRALVAAPGIAVTATDLSQPMLDTAREQCDSAAVAWRAADALDLPFPAASFDAVACQFGVMFFPDKPRGYAEARRVLRPGGAFHFNVWDRLEENPAVRLVDDTVNAAAGDVPIDFVRRIPYGYHDPERIRTDLAASGFAEVEIETLAGTSLATAEQWAAAICQATPLRRALEAHPNLDVAAATALATEALRREYGSSHFVVPISWLQVAARPVSG